MNVIVSIILALTFLAACSQPRVFELGPDTYITSATTVEASEAERLALVEASEHCATMGKEIAVMKSSNVINIHGGSRLKLTFRCLTKDNPSIQRPGFTQTLDVTSRTHDIEASSQSARQENQPSFTAKSR
jgi:hypothetical protein